VEKKYLHFIDWLTSGLALHVLVQRNALKSGALFEQYEEGRNYCVYEAWDEIPLVAIRSEWK